MTAPISGKVLVSGSATGSLLRLRRPISFWGGVDPDTGRVIDPRHPDHGITIGGRVLAIPGTIGSSSSSAVLLELLRNGNAPAALLLSAVDAILVLGVVVAREMGYKTIPVLELGQETIDRLPAGRLQVSQSGQLIPVN